MIQCSQLTSLAFAAGVQSGGTIKFWQHYFGSDLLYEGVDINFLCKLFENKPAVTITLGNQSNATFWAEFLAGREPFDIVIDDGGHTMKQQMCVSNHLPLQMSIFHFVAVRGSAR